QPWAGQEYMEESRYCQLLIPLPRERIPNSSIPNTRTANLRAYRSTTSNQSACCGPRDDQIRRLQWPRGFSLRPAYRTTSRHLASVNEFSQRDGNHRGTAMKPSEINTDVCKIKPYVCG